MRKYIHILSVFIACAACDSLLIQVHNRIFSLYQELYDVEGDPSSPEYNRIYGKISAYHEMNNTLSGIEWSESQD